MLNYQRVYPGRRNSCHQPRPGVLLGSWFTKDDDTPSVLGATDQLLPQGSGIDTAAQNPTEGQGLSSTSGSVARLNGFLPKKSTGTYVWHWTLDTAGKIFFCESKIKIWATSMWIHVMKCIPENRDWRRNLTAQLDRLLLIECQPVSNGSGHPATPKKFTSSSVLDLHPPHSHGNSHSDMGSYYTNIIQNLRPCWVKSCSWWLDSTRSQSMVISSPFLMVNKHNNWHHFARPPGLCCSLPESSHQDGRCSLSSHRLDH